MPSRTGFAMNHLARGGRAGTDTCPNSGSRFWARDKKEPGVLTPAQGKETLDAHSNATFGRLPILDRVGSEQEPLPDPANRNPILAEIGPQGQSQSYPGGTKGTVLGIRTSGNAEPLNTLPLEPVKNSRKIKFQPQMNTDKRR